MAQDRAPPCPSAARSALLALALALMTGTAALAAPPPAGPPPEPGRAAWLGLHYIDTSTEGAINGPRPDEAARVAMAASLVAEDLTARGFTLVEPPPERLAAILDPLKSNGADLAIARELGADYAIEGQVQKVSNLILSLNLHVRDARTGRDIRAGAVDIRGNTDESFRRGFAYLLRNTIFRKE